MERVTNQEPGLVNPTRHDRVRARSAAAVNELLDRETEARIARLRGASLLEVNRRLEELDREWDIDRALILLFSGLGGLTFGLGMRKVGRLKRWNGWLSLFSTQLGFLGVHAAYGWCPPIAVLRRLGFRTNHEIEAERRILEGLTSSRVASGSASAATAMRVQRG